MAGKVEKTCGADIHKDFLIATILSTDGLKLQHRFDTHLDGLLEFKSWLNENGCHKVAVESTGTYWISIYNALYGSVNFILANAYQIKSIPGRKTDTLDSEWIAEVCLKNLISPSRILPKGDRDLRALTRARESLIKIRTSIKNQVHQELESASIKLTLVLSDSFGKSGRHIVEGLLNGFDLDEVIESIPSSRIRARKEKIRSVLQSNLSQEQAFLIRSLLNSIDSVSKQIAEIDSKVSVLFSEKAEDLRIAMSIPGIGFISASTILAEIGDFRNFGSADKLAAYFGLVPSVYQSAGRQINGHITKRGSPHIRRMLIEVAHAIARSKANSRLKKFFLRVRKRRGAKIALVALARKVLCILHHLLMNRETYRNEESGNPKCIKKADRPSSDAMSLDEIIKVITKAGYEVKKKSYSFEE
jgi:transposase